jgi:hypothetical protein
MADNDGRDGLTVKQLWKCRGKRSSAVAVLVVAVIAALVSPALASTLPPSAEALGVTALPTTPEVGGPPTSSGAGYVAPYSTTPSETSAYAICPAPTATLESCLAVGVPNASNLAALGLPHPSYEGSGKNGGFSPADLRSAYKLPSEGGEGQTVAITIAFDDPNAETDLAKYREEYKLGACIKSSGCFKKVNQKGEEGSYPAANAEWAEETSLDLDMVSAACPKCHIVLVEAENNEDSNLYPAVEEAASAGLGATVISDSWAGGEYSTETAEDHYFKHAGTPILFASGDSGYGVEYPAASSNVVAVGGTSLKKAENTRGWSESAWSGAGSGCSAYEPKPAWQKDEGCTKRTDVDVSAVADPQTPVSVYDSYEHAGWLLLGGTSVATPLMAGVEALSSSTFRSAGPSAFSPSGQGGELFDPTEGENALCGTYLCQAEVGYDGPTGWGTPDGTLSLPVAVTEAASVASTSKATLHGSVRPGGLETKYHFEYGETTSYGTIIPIPDKGVGSGTEYVEVSQAIEGLKGQRTYHFRITATNSEGTFHGVDRTFGTTAPSATTGTASEINIYHATLNGSVNPEGAASSYYFEYGPTTSYGSKMPLKAKEVGAGTKAVEVSTPIVALSGNTTYHYRIVAKNTGGTTNGSDKTFLTKPPEWRARLLPQPGESGEERRAYGISCARSDACVAVGFNFRLGTYKTKVTLAESWNGEAWSAMSTPNPSGLEEGTAHNRYAMLRGVSCDSVTDCTAVGLYRGTAEAVEPLSDHWDGSKWTELTTPKPSGATEAELDGVSCVSSTACEAVGSYKNSSGTKVTLAEHWNGTTWEEQATPNPSGATSSRLVGVSCTSSTQCTAVGYFKNSSNVEKTLAERWNGTKWEEQSTPNPTGTPIATLEGVSCSSSTECTAVGAYDKQPHFVPLAERWNGSTWVEQSAPVLDEEGGLHSVSCTSSNACTAAGSYYSPAPFDKGFRSLVERWGGSTWSILEIATLSVPAGWWHESWLNGISCSEAEVCGSVGQSLSAPKGSTAHEIAYANQTLGRPKVATESASGITQTEATLNATVNPNGVETKYYFEYGPTTSYGTKTTEVSGGSGMSNLKASQAITGLTASTTYHFRIVATNVNGTSEGADQVFSTTGKPTAETQPATGVTATGATLVGTVNPRGSETKYYFDYGSTEAYGTKTAEASGGSGTSNVEATKAITGLVEDQTYHFRVVATNSFGTTLGKDVTFKTPEYPGTWKITTTLNPSETLDSYLRGISCTSSSACTAVGEYTLNASTYMPMAERWNGSEWALQSTPNPSGAKTTELLGVSCTSATSCVAVGYYESSGGVYFSLTEIWNGTEWKIQATAEPSGTLNSLLKAVSCTSSTACTATGWYESSAGVEVPWAARWNGTEWTVQSMPAPTGAKASYPNGVSCTSATSCTTAGYYVNSSSVNVLFAESWSGSEWTIRTTPTPSGATKTRVSGVSCTSSTACTLVGEYTNSSGVEVTLAERWNGTEWAVQSTPNPAEAKGNHLNGGVSCTTSTTCTAVGVYQNSAGKYATLAEQWKGTEWKIQATPNNEKGEGWLTGGVSCSSFMSCVAVGNAGKTLAEIYG